MSAPGSVRQGSIQIHISIFALVLIADLHLDP